VARMETLTTKVTKINGRYHCRLLNKTKVVDEMACEERVDIGYCMRWMLRMHDKCGGVSLMADASRHRRDAEGGWKNAEVVGKVWYPNQIPIKE
jgi:hypothetical protein